MPVRFVIGRAGSGKTAFCLAAIREKLKESPLGHPLVLLVPEQASFQAEHALVTTPGLSGTVRAQVLSFRRLAFRIMQETGGTTRTPIHDTGKRMLLYKIIHQHSQRLRLFCHSAEQVGFLQELNELFNEFSRYLVSADQLNELEKRLADNPDSPLFADKMHDLAAIYREYEREMHSRYVDGEDLLRILAEQLPGSDYVKSAEIWIDGFNGFTPQEFAVVMQLMKHARHVTVTFCADKAYDVPDMLDELNVFHPVARTMIRIRESMRESGLKLEPHILLPDPAERRFVSSPELAHLEKCLAQNMIAAKYAPRPTNRAQTAARRGVPQIMLCAAVNRRAEVEGAAREMIRLVRDHGFRWRDFAVLVRNMEDYDHLAAAVFTDYGIPFFLDQKRPVMDHPLVEFIRSALETIRFHWRYDAVFRAVKTDFLLPFEDENLPFTGGDWPNGKEEPPLRDKKRGGENSADAVSAARREMDLLENYVLAFGIQGSQWTSGEPWTYTYAPSLEPDAGQQSGRDEEFLRRINACREWVSRPLLAFQKQIRQASTVKDMVQALYDLLVCVRAPERLERWSAADVGRGMPEKAQEHRQIWNSVMDMLDQFVEVMGEENMTLELFCGMLDTGLKAIRLGLVPPSLDQVLIGSIDRTRSSQVRCCFILGVNDGVLPAKMKENGVLSEREREILADTGLELAPGSRRKLLDEQFLAYTALSLPSGHLWLSYPLADEEGRAMLPSEIVRRVKKLFPHIRERMLPAGPDESFRQPRLEDHADPWEFVTVPERTLSFLIPRLRAWKESGRLEDLWREVYNWFASNEFWREKLKRLVFGLFYGNQEAPLSRETARQLYGDHLVVSVSRLEQFISCPFSHFAAYGLKLKERKVYRLTPPDIGQLFHAALNRIISAVQRDQKDLARLTHDEWALYTDQAVHELLPRLRGEILLSSKRYHYIAKKLKTIVERSSEALGSHAARSTFVPVGLELDFGRGKTLPPLVFSVDEGLTMEIAGRIDRVDCAQGEQGLLLRVIDYKSSQTPLRLAEIYHGLSLQLLTYLDIVVTFAEDWLGKPALPAGALYFHVHNPMLKTSNGYPPQKAQEEWLKRFKMQGLVLKDRDVVRCMDTALDKGYSPVIPVALKTDGDFYQQSAVYTLDQWRQLKNANRRRILQLGKKMSGGAVEIRPYRLGSKTPCAFCPYKAICQFDPQYAENDFAFLPALNQEEVWDRLSREAGQNHGMAQPLDRGRSREINRQKDERGASAAKEVQS